MTDEDLLQLGAEVANDPTLGGMCRQGRPLTNVEMSALLRWHKEPSQRLAESAVGFCQRLLNWLKESSKGDENG